MFTSYYTHLNDASQNPKKAVFCALCQYIMSTALCKLRGLARHSVCNNTVKIKEIASWLWYLLSVSTTSCVSIRVYVNLVFFAFRCGGGSFPFLPAPALRLVAVSRQGKGCLLLLPLFVSSWAVLLALFGLSPFGSPFVLLLDFSAGSAFGLLACSFFLLYGFRFLFLAFLGIVFFCYLLISASVFRISSQLFSLVRSASLRLPDLRYAIFRVLFTMVILGASAVCLSLFCRGP